MLDADAYGVIHTGKCGVAEIVHWRIFQHCAHTPNHKRRHDSWGVSGEPQRKSKKGSVVLARKDEFLRMNFLSIREKQKNQDVFAARGKGAARCAIFTPRNLSLCSARVPAELLGRRLYV